MSPRETLSANTLFHYTKNLDRLESILIKEFYPRFCLEPLAFHPTKPDREVAIPLVSFCDIPLSQIKNHVKLYGNYAIGLSKEWGLKKGITPVIYTHRGSPLPKSIKMMVDKAKTASEESFWEEHLWTVSVYLKPYEGKLWRKDKYVDGIRFYDEREWRYVPTFEQASAAGFDAGPVLSKKEFFDANRVEEGNEKLQQCRLGFTPKDIKYLIVKTERELSDFVMRVRQIKEAKYPPEDIEVLVTRIISMEQIEQDF
jgi:hypothetical protein